MRTPNLIRFWNRIFQQLPRQFATYLMVGVSMAVLFNNCGSDKDQPRTFNQLNSKATISFDQQLVPQIKAGSIQDAMFAQGYLHASQSGDQIWSLLQAFKGNPEKLEGRFQSWAQLFHAFPLQQVAEESLQLHDPVLKDAMSSFLEGMKAGGRHNDWSLTDLITLQKGYAFLFNDSLAQAWNDHLRSLPPNSPPPFTVSEEGLTLFDGPQLECVRDGAEMPFRQQYRAAPSLWFAFKPLRLITPELECQGMGLAGLPLIWSGTTPKVQFLHTPIQGQTAFIFGMDKASADLIDAMKEPSHLNEYVQKGVALNALQASGNVALAPRFYWTGLRPSAEFQAMWDLLHAQSLESASYSHEPFQVPFSEVIIGTSLYPPLVRLIGTTDLDREKARSERYSFPFSGNAYLNSNQTPQVRGLLFSSDSMNSDDRLVKTVKLWLDGPLKLLLAKEDWQKASTLFAKNSQNRVMATQMLWRELLAESGQDWPPEITRSRALQVRERLLELYDRSQTIDWDANSQQRIQNLGVVLSRIIMELDNNAERITYFLPKDPKTAYPFPQPSPSPDQGEGLFFCGFQSEIHLATTHNMALEPSEKGVRAVFRTLPFAVTGLPKEPKGKAWKRPSRITLLPEADSP